MPKDRSIIVGLLKSQQVYILNNQPGTSFEQAKSSTGRSKEALIHHSCFAYTGQIDDAGSGSGTLFLIRCQKFENSM